MNHPGQSASALSGRTGMTLVAILATAALLRLYDLGSLPPAHYRDVALTALDALRAAAGEPRLHYTYDEGLYSNIMGLFFLAFGVHDWSVRLPGALFGIATCWGVFRLGVALGLRRAGLFAAALLGASFWHVLLSRSGFRAILLPLLLVLSMTLLVEGLRRVSPLRMAGAGLLFGLGVHVYPAIRFAPLMVPIFLLALLGRDAAAWRRAARGLALFVLGAMVIASPMLLHYVDHPEHFTYPHRLVSIFSPGVTVSDALVHLQHNLFATLGMFHLRGDANWRHNIAGAPMLDPLSGLLLVIGLLVCLRSRLSPSSALLLGWLCALLLPGLLSIEGVPHGLRNSAILPAVALICGVGMVALEHLVARRFTARRAAVVAFTLLCLLTVFTGWRYFGVWGNHPAVAAAHDGGYRAAARALLSAPAGALRIVVANGSGFPAYGHPAETHPFRFEMRDDPPLIVHPRDSDRLALDGREAYVAFEHPTTEGMAMLRRLNPDAPIRVLDDADLSPDAPVYRVN